MYRVSHVNTSLQAHSVSDYRIPCRYVTAAVGPHEQPKPDTLPQKEATGSRPKLTKKSWKGDGKPALVAGWGDDSKAADGKGVILILADTCNTTDTSSARCQPRQLALRTLRCLKCNSIARQFSEYYPDSLLGMRLQVEDL
jgi:hypothetical protein